jgi:tetratricopeptide (TPR) repeat protein
VILFAALALRDSGEEAREEGVEEAGVDAPGRTRRPAVPVPPKPPVHDPAREKAILAYRTAAGEAKSAEDWYAAGAAAAEAGFPLNARLHFLEAARLDPDLEVAWEALGYRRYALPADSGFLLEAPGLLEDLKRYDGAWLDPRKLEEIAEAESASLEAAREAFEARQALGDYAKVEEVRRRIHEGKGFRDRVWGDRPALPYFLFDERGKKGERLLSRADSDFLVNKKLGMLKKVYDFILERWMKPGGFARDASRPLVAVIFKNRSSFRDYNRSVGVHLPAGAIAYFSRLNKFIFVYDAAAQSPEGQDHQDGILFHEATHQIVDAFLASGSGMGRVSYWFNEGIAEYVGSVKRVYGEGDEVHWTFGAENPGRIREFHTARRPDWNARTRKQGITSTYAFTLRELLTKCRTPWGTRRTLQGKIPGKAWPKFSSGGSAGSLIYAQSYLLLYFAYACGKAEYRDGMDRYMRLEFRGKGSLASFMKAFGLKGEEDLERFEAEMLAFHESRVPDNLKRKR